MNYLIGWRVYKNDWAFAGHQIDWIIDGKTIKKEDVLFLIETPISKEYESEFIKRGYNIYHLQRFKNRWLRLICYIPSWFILLYKHSLKNYVAYNSYSWIHRIRNWILKEHGVITWCYMHSRNFMDLYCPESEMLDYKFMPMCRNNFDYYVGWAMDKLWLKKYNKKMKFIDVGCLWSE